MEKLITTFNCPARLERFKISILRLCDSEGYSGHPNRVLQAAVRAATILFRADKSWTIRSGKTGRNERRTLFLNGTLISDLARCRPLLSKHGVEKCLEKLIQHIGRLKRWPTMSADPGLPLPIYSALCEVLEEIHSKKMQVHKGDADTEQPAIRRRAIDAAAAPEPARSDDGPSRGARRERAETVKELKRPGLVVDGMLRREEQNDDDFCVSVVIDTNTLLHHKNRFKGILGDFDFGDLLSIYVPWTVLSELDRLSKRKGSHAKKLAKDAVRYVQNSLKSRRSQWECQTCIQWKRADGLFKPQCADDEILQACLQLRGLSGPREKIILWSEDRNLQNKCLANGIRTCDSTNLKEEISGACSKAA